MPPFSVDALAVHRQPPIAAAQLALGALEFGVVCDAWPVQLLAQLTEKTDQKCWLLLVGSVSKKELPRLGKTSWMAVRYWREVGEDAGALVEEGVELGQRARAAG